MPFLRVSHGPTATAGDGAKASALSWLLRVQTAAVVVAGCCVMSSERKGQGTPAWTTVL